MSRALSDKFNREVKYVNKDFAEYRRALINHAKNYFPNTYSDFNESSPAMMFVEMAAYVGDVLSLYSDVQLQESFLYTVNEKINLYNLSQGLGYKPQTKVPSQVDLDIMQLVPSIGNGTGSMPDYNYALVVEEGLQAYTDEENYFRTVDPVDFRFSSSFDPTEVSVYSVADDGTIEYYLLKKCVRAVAGEVRTAEYTFADAKIYDKIVLPDEEISGINSITDADGNTWYEVPFLAQDQVPVSLKNIPYNDPVLAQHSDSAPYLLCYVQTERRFITRLRKDDRLEIQFGAGLSQEADEEILPNPYNVAIGLDYFRRAEDVSIDPSNFLYTKTYGRAPSDTTLTVSYNVSQGINDNVQSNTITNIGSSTIIDPIGTTDATVLQTIKDSLSINNPKPAYGGANKKDLDVMREEAMANFAAQNRAVTREDYILRCYTMPGKYGSVCKAHVEQDTQKNNGSPFERIPNMYALNLYILAFDADKRFVPANDAIKENLRQYLRHYRLMTDAINIKDPAIINIGFEIDIVTRPDFSSNEVSLRVVNRMMELMAPEKVEINQPLLLSKMYTELDKIEGVQTIQKINVKNLYDRNSGYSGVVYDVEAATRGGVVYPSADACIFEVKYPKRDIEVRVVDI